MIETPYFNYHATAKKLITDGKLKGYYFTGEYRRVSPALVLLFDDLKHPVMPVREHKWSEYLPLLTEEKRLKALPGEERA